MPKNVARPEIDSREVFHCFTCKGDFTVDVPSRFSGDAKAKCNLCGAEHPKQIVDGEAVGMEPVADDATLFTAP